MNQMSEQLTRDTVANASSMSIRYGSPGLGKSSAQWMQFDFKGKS
jgi:hypothetical protein